MAKRKVIVVNEENKPKNKPGELWKAIPDFPGYEVSNQGRVRSVDRYLECTNRFGNRERRFYRGRILLSRLKEGYPSVTLGGIHDERGYNIHVLLMRAFVGPYPSKDHEIAHDDGNRCNNFLSNLRYKTYQEQYQDRVRHGRAQRGEGHYNSKLTEQDVREIRKSKDTHRTLANRYGVTRGAIIQVKNGYSWKWLDVEDS